MEEQGYQIFVPDEEEPDRSSNVFYNPEMETNRDLSTAAAEVFLSRADIEKPRICDALSASGIRGFRYSSLGKIYLNDTNPQAVESIEKGVEANNIDAEVSEQDANVFLSEHRNFFHVIDVDPFGPFTRFLDSSARAANHSSFVGLTATDNAAPSGSYPKVCRRRYASKPLKNSFMHETALRIYIRTVFENFARYDKAFDPKICWHEQHYSRVSGRVTESKQRANNAVDNIGHLSFCENCRWRKLDRRENCPNCDSETEIAGPLWTGKFVDQRFTEEMLEKMPEEQVSRELLELLHSEAEIVTPFYDIHELASNLEMSSPKREPVIEAIKDRGYPVSRTHFSPTGFRTDAPLDHIKETIRTV